MTSQELKSRQSLPLEYKIRYSEVKIAEWIDFCRTQGKKPCISKSGADSEVLLHLARTVDPAIPAVFVDTGQENATVVERNRAVPNLVVVRPDTSFHEVVKRYGYPAVSKQVSRYLSDLQNPTARNVDTRHLRLTGVRSDGQKGAQASILPKCYHHLISCGFRFSDQCCYHLKKKPLAKIQSQLGFLPMVGTLAEDSEARARAYLRTGCNSFNTGKSAPLSIWTRQDILTYIQQKRLEYPLCYGEIVGGPGTLEFTGESNTGCEGCLFGIKYDPTRIERVKQWSPARYRYYMEDLDYKTLIPLILRVNQPDPLAGIGW